MPPSRIQVVEVGPRDGFQMESAFIPTDLKVEVIDILGSAGLPKIEATSFVSPNVIGQMRDAQEVMSQIRRFPGVRYIALVPNVKGAGSVRLLPEPMWFVWLCVSAKVTTEEM